MTTIFHPELSFRARLILYNSNRNRQSRLVPGAWTINLEIGLSWLILLKWRQSWLYGHIWWYLRAIQGIGNLLSVPVGQWCLHRLKFPSYSLPLMVSWAWSSRLVHWQCAIDFLSHNDPHLPQVFYNDMCQTLSLTLLTNNTKKHYKFWEKPHKFLFLAPTGAQEITISVRPFGPNLSRAFNHHFLGCLRAVLCLS